jgi:hypothetical protein
MNLCAMTTIVLLALVMSAPALALDVSCSAGEDGQCEFTSDSSKNIGATPLVDEQDLIQAKTKMNRRSEVKEHGHGYDIGELFDSTTGVAGPTQQQKENIMNRLRAAADSSPGTETEDFGKWNTLNKMEYIEKIAEHQSAQASSSWQHHGKNTNQPKHHHHGNNTCADPGDGSKRVWFICKGQKPPPPTDAEQMFGVKVATEMCCTEEASIDCLCCTDFAKPLDFKDCGTMQLDAAQKPPGSPGAMEQAAQDNSIVIEDSSIVVVCTMDRAMGRLKPDVSLMQTKSTKIALPVQCIDRQFTPEELSGSGGKQPGQILFDERILFLSQQGLPNQAIPTCKDTVSGTCPIGTPKAGQEPNSAGEEALSKLNKTSFLTITVAAGKFSGSLMTSGSFTMMAGGGF